MPKTIIGVMGPGQKATSADCQDATLLGKLIANEGWVLLSGGRKSGVMDAVNQGAHAAGGLTVGILPRRDLEAISEAVDIPIITDMGSARNYINALSCAAIIACGELSEGTISEIAFALQAGKPVVLLSDDIDGRRLFKRIGGELVSFAQTPQEAVALVRQRLTVGPE